MDKMTEGKFVVRRCVTAAVMLCTFQGFPHRPAPKRYGQMSCLFSDLYYCATSIRYCDLVAMGVNTDLKRKGLGKGMDAILGDPTIEPMPNDFTYLPIYRIEPNKEQPRTVFEQESIEELTDSIREHGVLSPLLVRAIDGGSYQIIAGERRWRAAREAGIAEIPARIIVADDKHMLEIAMVENVQRENLSPIEEARGYRALMESFGMTQDDVAQRVSKSRPAVTNALRLLSLPPEVMGYVLSGELSAGSARALLGLKDDETIRAAAKIVIKDEMSVREVEALVRRLNTEIIKDSKPSSKNSMEVDYILEAKNQLSEALKRRVNIKQGRGKGKIEIEYYDLDDFNILFDELLAKGLLNGEEEND